MKKTKGLSFTVLMLIVWVVRNGASGAEDSVLPHGEAPAALRSPYFPDPVHEFVWRNWTAVEPAKLAAILDASVEQVVAVAEGMGLPPTPFVQPEMRSRGYLTLIRRNWHLLPYEQLLELLDLTPERLSVMLREEDFLWYKLGRLKPACEPLRYEPPNDANKRRAAEIRHVLEEEFGERLRQPGEPPFDFVRRLSAPLPDYIPPGEANEQEQFQRIVYSYVAVFGDPLLHPELDPYPDGLLQRLSSVGINGVWLQAVLRDFAPGGPAFPEFGTDCETRLANLRALVQRAAKFGVRVFLYINEPRAMPPSFFKDRPELAGVEGAELTALCTSQTAVRQWMADALAHVFREVPDLGGVYAITASENLTNCASHGVWRSCPHCKERTDTDIFAEVVATIEEGVHRSAPDAEVLISDWGWRGHGEASDVVAQLPKKVTLMSVSEWNLPIERGGIQSLVGEYSISSVGPGPRALSHWKAARAAGLGAGTEIQFNNTCEIATVPYLPVLDLVAAHCHNLLSAEKVQAMLIGWTMGGHPSPNLEVVRRMSGFPLPSVSSVLDAIALERFGPEGAPHARKAWTLMSEAFREYPFHISVVYTSPIQWGPANPLYLSKTGYRATMWGIPYDDLDTWRGPYPPEIFASQFEKIVEGWKAGLSALGEAVDKTPADRREAVKSDQILAQAAFLHFQSVANQARFVAERDTLAAGSETLTVKDKNRLRGRIRALLESEIELASELYSLVKMDSRIGFEPSCHYFYLPIDLVEKVLNCRWLLVQFADENSASDPRG